jgi:hypothetical protein
MHGDVFVMNIDDEEESCDVMDLASFLEYAIWVVLHV